MKGSQRQCRQHSWYWARIWNRKNKELIKQRASSSKLRATVLLMTVSKTGEKLAPFFTLTKKIDSKKYWSMLPVLDPNFEGGGGPWG
jgi:hypothetical protein